MPFLKTDINHLLNRQKDSGLRSGSGVGVGHFTASMLEEKSSALHSSEHRIEASNLGEAIAASAAFLGVRIVAHDPPKWFRVYRMPEPDEDYFLVDIHVLRGKENICPKQDLTFPLLDSDIVSIGALVC